MKAAEYEELRSLLLVQQPLEDTFRAVRSVCPAVEFDTIVAIQSQELSRQLRSQIAKYRSRQRVQQCVSRYISGEDLLDISRYFETPPCVMARVLLEHMLGLKKQQITACLKNPSLLPEGPFTINVHGNSSKTISLSKAKIAHDLFRCVTSDLTMSPYVETIRRITGQEYESLLYEKLKSLGIPFQSEEALRDAGFSKTPDVKLEVPIGVRSRLVTWIDSKASFGDEFMHKCQAKDQFQSYVNRYGPGLVIYWLGFVEELDDNPDVLLLDHFPSTSDIVCLSFASPINNTSCTF